MSPESTAEDFNMSAEPIKFGPFTITLPPNRGGPRQFVLSEATEKTHIAYRSITAKSLVAKISSLKNGEEEKQLSSQGGQEADATLVAGCLTEIMPDQSEKSVDVNFVLSLPRRITSRLYAKVRAMSGMDEDEETEQFLAKRIESDKRKLSQIRERGEPGKSERPSTATTSA